MRRKPRRYEILVEASKLRAKPVTFRTEEHPMFNPRVRDGRCTGHLNSMENIDNSSSVCLRSIQQTLRFTFGLVPIIAGLDKFTNLLTPWAHYLAPSLIGLLPFSADNFMRIVGVIEIVAGVLVLMKPRLGAMVVCAWLILIALTLVIGGNYYDVAVRDVVMAIGALTLARLTVVIEK
jgi:uncharacterized membrane protein YphA (DoxX/SURF4 family)